MADLLDRSPAVAPRPDTALLRDVARRVLWLSTAIVDAANRGRPNSSGVKSGGHQASSASMVDIMVALWFSELAADDRVSVKPHAAPVLHAINFLLGDLGEDYLPRLRAKGGLQSYPSRRKDPDQVDFSTGSVGIGATAPIWAAIAHRYLRSRTSQVPRPGRYISLLGDAELDEGAVWEAVADPAVAKLGELVWVVDLNRQSLDRIIPDIQIHRLRGMFEAAGWEVVELKWGRRLTAVFERPGGLELRARLESMSNEEYQRLLRVDDSDLFDRLLAGDVSGDLSTLLSSMDAAELASAIRDLGGHDLDLLVDTFATLDESRPSVVFAYTVKGRGLPTEGHPNNHSALLTEAQIAQLAAECSVDPAQPWEPFLPGSAADTLCHRRAVELARPPVASVRPAEVPTSLGHPHRKPTSTQSALGRLLTDLHRDAPQVASRVVTCSPDVASSTNLGGWINKVGVWSVTDRTDWFADDSQRLLKWSESPQGQHLELGIAEVNLVSLIAELGATWSRWGEQLIPIGTLYDPFVTRALEPWSYGIYAGGQSILVGTPSGVTLAPEGGAHQSIVTPSVGLEQPECTYWEPAFAQDLEWCLLEAMRHIGTPDGRSSYFRLSTRPIDPAIAAVPADPDGMERRRRLAVAGGYRVCGDATTDEVTLVGVGAVMPEVMSAASALEATGVRAGVLCLTSPDLLFRSWMQRQRVGGASATDILSVLLPQEYPAPIVTIQDGHPHTLAFLAAARGDRLLSLGVSDFGQSSDLADAYALHGLDTTSIVQGALSVLRRL